MFSRSSPPPLLTLGGSGSAATFFVKAVFYLWLRRTVRFLVPFLSMLVMFSALMARLEAKLGPSSETLRVIRQEMERDYYNADPRLVDPLLARCEHPSCFSHALGT